MNNTKTGHSFEVTCFIYILWQLLHLKYKIKSRTISRQMECTPKSVSSYENIIHNLIQDYCYIHLPTSIENGNDHTVFHHMSNTDILHQIHHLQK